jgi:hypothetical protein
MSFWIAPSEKYVDQITDAENFRQAAPDYWNPRLDAIAELREANRALEAYTSFSIGMAGASRKTGDWKRVASVPHTILQAALVLEPDLLLEKKNFYRWLDRHPEYQAYQRTQGRRI